jgi:tRNA pseudouridine38-40 synthase
MKGPLRNIKIVISYDGTGYAGWQSQKNATAIQDLLESAVAKVTGEKVRLIGSGRTDAGVHAKGQVANFRTRSRIALANLKAALNSILPESIVVSRVDSAPPAFHARRMARSKIYRYTIKNSGVPDPFSRAFAAASFHRLDIHAMKRAARHLKGRHDFSSFQAKGATRKRNIRTLKTITIEKEGDMIYIYMEADGFLRNMARNIAGTLMEVGRGRFAAGDVRKILLKNDRTLAGPTAPAKGLCLVKVKY